MKIITLGLRFGKTTFSKIISKELNLSIFQIDQIFFKGWIEREHYKFLQDFAVILSTDTGLLTAI